MTRRAILPAGLLVAVLAWLPSLAFGQNASCSLGGTVYDTSNAVVPNAKVVLTDEATNTTRETVSNNSGFFSLSGHPTRLPQGRHFGAWLRRLGACTYRLQPG